MTEVAEIIVFFQVIVYISIVILINLAGGFSVKKMTVVKWLGACTMERTYDIIIVVCSGSFAAAVELIVLNADFDALGDLDFSAAFLLLFFERFMILAEVESRTEIQDRDSRDRSGR